MNRAATTRDRAREPRRGGRPGKGATAVRPRVPGRRRTRRRVDPRRRRLTAAAVLVAGAAVVAWVVLASPLLAVHTVRIDGAGTLTSAEVEQAAGIAPGTPLLRVDTGDAAARVARLPQVASVEVSRGWPHTVVVTLAERVPVAVVDQGGTRSLVDRDGVLFDTITSAAPAGVVPLAVARPGPEDRATTAAVGAVVALPTAVRREVTGVSATTPDDVTLTLTDGRTVLWGSVDQTPRKAQVLAGLLDQIEAGTLEEARTLDVSTPDAVVLR